MRFVDLEAIRPKILPQIDDLETAKAEILGEKDVEKRRALIKHYRKRWVAVRDAFEEYSDGKCWYVECSSPGADNDIDHYRPKLRLAQDPAHPGYYWLAFEWRNLRLSCQRANRLRKHPETGETGGKGDNFPLVNPDARARTPKDNLAREIPAILDPTDRDDVALVTFGRGGDVELVLARKGEPVAEAKLEASRRYLHLNWPRFLEARVKLYHQIERFVRSGEDLAPEESDGMHVVAQAFLDICQELSRWMGPQEQYSMAARAYVEMFRDRWWVRDIVLQVRR